MKPPSVIVNVILIFLALNEEGICYENLLNIKLIYGKQQRSDTFLTGSTSFIVKKREIDR